MTISRLSSRPLQAGLAAAFLGLNGLAWAVQPAAAAAASSASPASLASLASSASPPSLASSASSASAGPPTASARLWPPIAALVGDAPCDDQRQCHTAAIGAKACGGPSGFLAWSDKTTDPAALQAAVAAHAQAQIAENKASGLASDCAMLQPPPAVCRPRASVGRKSCELGQGGTSSAI